MIGSFCCWRNKISHLFRDIEVLVRGNQGSWKYGSRQPLALEMSTVPSSMCPISANPPKPRRFFKKSPLPDAYKKKCANQTARLNWTGSSVKRARTISKRRAIVDASAITSITLPQPPKARQGQQIEDGAEEYAATAPSLHKLDASTSTEQGFVMMDVDEFQQLLHLVAAGIGQAASTTKGSKAQVGFCLSHAFKTKIDSVGRVFKSMCNPIDNAAGREDSDAEEMGAEN